MADDRALVGTPYDPDGPVFSSDPVRDQALRLLLPFVLCGAFLAGIGLWLPFDRFAVLAALIVAYIVPPAGKETVIPVGIVLGLPWWLIAVTIAVFDLLGALFMVWNFHFIFRIPVLGGWLLTWMDRSRKYLDARPWLERFSCAGLALFVMIPFESSGGVAGAVIGRLIGMRNAEIVLCVAIGAFAGCIAVALGADLVMAALGRDLVFGLAAIGVITVAIAAAAGVRRITTRRHAAEKRED
jgi:uncharacterized membrane protein